MQEMRRTITRGSIMTRRVVSIYQRRKMGSGAEIEDAREGTSIESTMDLVMGIYPPHMLLNTRKLHQVQKCLMEPGDSQWDEAGLLFQPQVSRFSDHVCYMHGI